MNDNLPTMKIETIEDRIYHEITAVGMRNVKG